MQSAFIFFVVIYGFKKLMKQYQYVGYSSYLTNFLPIINNLAPWLS